MNSIEQAMLKALKPTIAIRAIHLNGTEVPLNLLEYITSSLKPRNEVLLDKDNKVIYVGKKL